MEVGFCLQSDKWMKLSDWCKSLDEGSPFLFMAFNSCHAWIDGFLDVAFELTTYGIFVVAVSSLEPWL